MAKDRTRDGGDDDLDGGPTVVGAWHRTDGGRRLLRVDGDDSVATARDVAHVVDARAAAFTLDPSASTDEVPLVTESPRALAPPPSVAPLSETDRARAREEALSSRDRLVAGRYRVGRVLGAGGMGTVFEAVHADLGKRVALKVLAPFFEREGEAVARFLREARAASRIESDHIAQVFDVGDDLHLGLYMVMELLRGEDLARTLATRGRLRPEEAAGVAWQVSLALERAHDAGVVHRDLKPANVFLAGADDGSIKVKVLDFGVAKLVRDAQELEQKAITRAGTFVGTPIYMAPEQAQGSSSIDARADLYALGAVLYECVAGTPPYPEGEPYERTLYRIAHEPTPNLARAAPDAPSPLVALVAALMARDPHARPATARDVRARLAAIFPSLKHRTLRLASDAAPPSPPSLPTVPPPRTASAVVLASRGSTLPPAARKVTTLGLAALGAMVAASIAIALVAARDGGTLREGAAVATGAPAPLEPEPAAPEATSAPAPAPPATGTAAIAATAPDPTRDALEALEHGEATRARDLALDALRATPDDADLWLVLAAAHEALGDKPATRRDYETCAKDARGDRVAECRAMLAR